MVSSAMGAPSKIKIKRVERLSPKAVRITLDPGLDAPKWKNIPGGYLTFCLPIAENVLHRSYSLVPVSYTHLRAPRDLSTSRMPSSA